MRTSLLIFLTSCWGHAELFLREQFRMTPILSEEFSMSPNVAHCLPISPNVALVFISAFAIRGQ